MTDYLPEFTRESRELLEEIEVCLTAIERHTADEDTLATLFRCIHTFKGSCSLLALKPLEHTAHAAEDLVLLITPENPQEINQRHLLTLRKLLIALNESVDKLDEAGAPLALNILDDSGAINWNKIGDAIEGWASDCNKKITVKSTIPDNDKILNALNKVKPAIIHILRNAVVHGIEAAEERISNNKADNGTIKIAVTTPVSPGSDSFTLILEDDGYGIQLEKVMEKAHESRLADIETLRHLPAEQLYEFLFMPGFTTTDKTTPLSGRGMGLDIARALIESAGGTIALHTTAGQGTTFVLNLPVSKD